jgi:diguanylate cyclase (GGDEF)-like protein
MIGCMRKSRSYTPYVLLTSLVVGAFIAAFFALQGGLQPLAWDSLGLLLVLAITVRIFGFHLEERVVVTLDTAVFVAALFILGSAGAALVVGGAVLMEMSGRALVRRPERGWLDQLQTMLFTAVVTVGGLLVMAWLVGTEDLVLRTNAWGAFTFNPAERDALARAAWWKIPLVTLGFVVLQGSLVLVRHTLLGRSFTALLKHVLLPTLGADLALVPLSYLTVFAHYPHLYASVGHPSAIFAMLLATYALLAAGVHRLAAYGNVVRSRLADMERLNQFHAAISSSLQINLLSELVVDNLLRRFSYVDGAALLLYRESLFRVSARDREREAAYRREIEEFLKSRKEDLSPQRLFLAFGPAAAKSGTLVLFARPKHTFSRGEMRFFRLLVNIIEISVDNARLYEMATIDGLTGLYVRRYFEQRLVEEFIRSGRYGDNFALILLDLNYFKEINDRFGHLVGDRILKAVGEILRDSVRSMDVPARYGGDEFAILLPRASYEDAEVVRRRVEEGLGRYVCQFKGEEIRASACVGISSYLTDKPSDPTELILKADHRLYEAKRGRTPQHLAV